MINGLRTPPLINGVEPAWANLTVNIAGVPAVGITAIDYDDKQTIENIYGMGQNPVGRGYGNIEATCKLTLLMSEVEAMRAASVTGRLQDIAPFDIVVSYTPVNATKIITHVIRNCQFTNNPVSHAQASLKTEVSLDLLPSHIEWN
jgi:hypothetical protein